MIESKKKISLVVPVFNEEHALDAFFTRTDHVFRTSDILQKFDVEYVFVNDGSTDRTLELLSGLVASRPNVVVLDFSRNFGKEAALTAGLDSATGDAIIPIDADLQDPPELIPQMVELWLSGNEVVLARRSDRKSDHPLKRNTARLFYRLHNSISDIAIPPDVGDYRLMDRMVVDALKRLPENKRFMKGLFAWVGFKTTFIDYTREARCGGDSKFAGWALWRLAVEGFTSFSTVPLVVWSYVGTFISTISFAFGLTIVLQKMFWDISIPGYAALASAIFFLGGVQLIGIGIIGEYLGRVYFEAKGRPVYLVRKTLRSPV
ncbi:glycosyltransferase [Hyphomicrobium methylovorum]|uniref:glycosyltransferase family 2 protein n=1 Tax=Hyphomicrobium methylovorum TaxID=84 RepID=UPI0015E6DBEE|nr:glycosyltransferase family 2 protein [Hyphomicrobium methylovorum]MBA2125888.1 glycosyltransferase [Hyphomicrobium methylovorum]